MLQIGKRYKHIEDNKCHLNIHIQLQMKKEKIYHENIIEKYNKYNK